MIAVIVCLLIVASLLVFMSVVLVFKPGSKNKQIARLQTAVSLLSSMVESGEEHSDTSRRIVREALED